MYSSTPVRTEFIKCMKFLKVTREMYDGGLDGPFRVILNRWPSCGLWARVGVRDGRGDQAAVVDHQKYLQQNCCGSWKFGNIQYFTRTLR